MMEQKGPKLPVFLVGDDNATLLAHFKVTPPVERLIRGLIARRGWTLRRFADACIAAYLEVRAGLHGAGERMLYEAAPRWGSSRRAALCSSSKRGQTSTIMSTAQRTTPPRSSTCARSTTRASWTLMMRSAPRCP